MLVYFPSKALLRPPLKTHRCVTQSLICPWWKKRDFKYFLDYYKLGMFGSQRRLVFYLSSIFLFFRALYETQRYEGSTPLPRFQSKSVIRLLTSFDKRKTKKLTLHLSFNPFLCGDTPAPLSFIIARAKPFEGIKQFATILTNPKKIWVCWVRLQRVKWHEKLSMSIY